MMGVMRTSNKKKIKNQETKKLKPTFMVFFFPSLPSPFAFEHQSLQTKIFIVVKMVIIHENDILLLNAFFGCTAQE